MATNIGILVDITTGKLHGYLVRNVNKLNNYDNVRATILNYIRTMSHTVNKQPRVDDPTPMEVDTLRTKGSGEGNTHCDICRREGHLGQRAIRQPEGE